MIHNEFKNIFVLPRLTPVASAADRRLKVHADGHVRRAGKGGLGGRGRDEREVPWRDSGTWGLAGGHGAAPSAVAPRFATSLPPNPLTRMEPAGEPHRPQPPAGPVRRAQRGAQECRCATTTTTPTPTTTASATTPMATAASRQGAEARRGRAKRPPPWTFRPSAHRAVTCIRSAQGRPASVRPGFLPRARPLCRELPNEAAASPYADRRLTAEETTQNDAPACCVGRAAGTRTLRARRARRARRRLGRCPARP